jgi:hypothetical protein
MDSSNILERLKEKQAKNKELGILISLHTEGITTEMKAKEQELRDRLDYRLMELEEAGLDAKIKIKQELLAMLHKRK